MKTFYLKNLSSEEIDALTKRPSIDTEKVFGVVKPILQDIKANGLSAVLKYAAKFDGFEGNKILIGDDEFSAAEKNLSPKIIVALKTAAVNIEKFHLKQKPLPYEIETAEEVKCSREYKAIENVGLYIPGGSAVLPSTMLMLAIPAKIAGCKRIVACSPAKDGKINDALLYAAKLCGIKEFYKIGGAQAIGLMAYGDKAIQKVNKIFGPGNQYVTAAKLLVSIDADGSSIDMPSGPSEVLVIADEKAKPAFVAADLLSQAEHGADSQVILLTDSEPNAKKIKTQITKQLEELPRKEIASKALENSFILITENIEQAIDFSNRYAPEHLILNFEDADLQKNKIVNAGSVFIGQYSPESAGDYASGTNHSLPTYGYAKTFGGVTVESFMKTITFQHLTKDGLKNISVAVETLAEAEGLQAHKNAVSIRIK
jgi:histidinol dehydrogenase